MNKSKQKGTAFETAVVDYVHGLMPDAIVVRQTMKGSKDEGDVAVYRDGRKFIIECKNTATIDLAGAVDEAAIECTNAAADLGIAVIKRRGKGVGESYAVIKLEDLKWLVT